MVMQISKFAVIIFTVALYGCVSSPRYTSVKSAGSSGESGSFSMVEEGIASYYGDEFDGRQTASGEIFDQDELTAAHKTLPFQTKVRVTNMSNGKEVVVKVNDRGPFVEGRIIDLSHAAAEKIGMIGTGTAKVRIEVIELGEVKTPKKK
jgi:rare lipoprotein A